MVKVTTGQHEGHGGGWEGRSVAAKCRLWRPGVGEGGSVFIVSHLLGMKSSCLRRGFGHLMLVFFSFLLILQYFALIFSVELLFIAVPGRRRSLS